MDLYFSPLACSMATRIALYEAGQRPTSSRSTPRPSRSWRMIRISTRSTRPGLCPSCVPTTAYLTEKPRSAARRRTLRRFRHRRQTAGIERSKLQRWLCFIGTELHKGLFTPLLGKTTPAEVKAYTLEKYLSRLAHLDNYLKGREYLLDHFSVADAYLTTVLNWSIATPMIDWTKYPNVMAYLERMKKRPAVAKALAEEFELYKAEMARHKAAA